MEKAETRETHDFMNVESFSQLPFIRPAPLKDKGPAIRLFGIEFGAGDESDSADTTTAEDAVSSATKETNDSSGDNNNRRFECHYCCRNFPTSQALGGHQNAHKRERQHAKRAHLQSAMVHGGLSDAAHLYGLVNYCSTPAALSSYPSWNSSTAAGRFYSGHHHHHQGSSYSQQPINGSPLGMWRVPSADAMGFHRGDRSLHPLPLFAGKELKAAAASQVGAGGGSSSQGAYGFETKGSMQDHVSLDLHL